ncbi:MAG: ribbon-helix-helix protein, CopG family [Richelia sp. RM1_1_1]|nr:ribbon-helix-helix protein, CopG family [Richelia sp. RM1_1_1]
MAKSKHREHGEIKKQVSVGLTPSSVEGLDKQAQRLGISRSQLIEMIGRGEISLSHVDKQILGESLIG